MAVESFFATLGGYFEAPALEFMDQTIAGALPWAQQTARGLLLISILVLGYLILTNSITLRAFATWLVRVMIVVALISQADLFNTWVRDFFFDTLPNDLASAVNGTSRRLTVTQQFDAVWSATLHEFGRVLGQATGLTNIPTRMELAVLKWLSFAALVVSWFITMIARLLSAVAICFAPFLIIGYLFAYTRRFVDSWLSVMATLILVQLGSAIFIRIVMAGNALFLRNVSSTMEGGIEAMVVQIGYLAIWLWIAALAMIGVVWIALRIGSTYAPVIEGAPAAAAASIAASARGAFAGARAAAGASHGAYAGARAAGSSARARAAGAARGAYAGARRARAA